MLGLSEAVPFARSRRNRGARQMAVNLDALLPLLAGRLAGPAAAEARGSSPLLPPAGLQGYGYTAGLIRLQSMAPIGFTRGRWRWSLQGRTST
jgi:hypothetical protein